MRRNVPRSIPFSLGVAIALSLVAAAPNAHAKPETAPDLSGAWELDSGRSDDPRKVVDSAIQDMMSGGMHRGGFMGHGPWMHGGGSGNEEDRHAMLERLRKSLEPPKTLDIDPGPDRLHLAEEGARPRDIYLDGRKREILLDDGVTAEYRAKWKSGVLVYEERTKAKDSIKRTERYELRRNGSELVVTVDVDPPGRMPDLSVRRLYVRDSGESRGSSSSPPAPDVAAAPPPAKGRGISPWLVAGGIMAVKLVVLGIVLF